MELVLNLVWLSAALFLAGLWLGHAPGQGSSRRLQLAALLLLAAILLPVVSATDDILLSDCTAESTSGQRKGNSFSAPHPVLLLPAADGPIAAFAFSSAPKSTLLSVEPPQERALSFLRMPFSNRPPPQA